MEIISNPERKGLKLKAALFDFDGTISALRHGWEQIMEPLMLEMIVGTTQIDDELVKEVREYIDQSTGIQTYYQMKWLAGAVKSHGRNPVTIDDPWWYKAEYNKRLMEPVQKRKESITSGQSPTKNFLIKGSEEFIKYLCNSGIDIYIASGTDQADVIEEADVLGLKKYFKDIAGAPPGKADCSKEAVLRRLVEVNKLEGPEVVVIGDGKVETALGREVGAITLGVASDEDKLCGVNPIKRARLVKAGAHAIIGDFGDLKGISKWLGI
jgi:phosphoglycolate phosphatase-like HAD superfamily hydrolase